MAKKKTATKRKRAAKKIQATFTRLEKLEDSQFFQRLESFDEKEAKQLALDVDTIVESAKSIADQIVRFLPQFTDHARTPVQRALLHGALGGPEEYQRDGRALPSGACG